MLSAMQILPIYF